MKTTRTILTASIFCVSIAGGVFGSNLLLKTAYCNVSGTITAVTVSDACTKNPGVDCLVNIDGVNYYTFATAAEAITHTAANRLKRPTK